MDPEQKPDGKFVVRDAATMRALAHPARITSLERLMRHGPATATELAEIVGLTPSAMSYHLRLLERAGLIVVADGRGDGRERVWQSRQSGGWTHDPAEDDDTEETRALSADLLRSVLAAQELRLAAWLSRSGDPDWQNSGFFTESVVLATNAEMAGILQRIDELLRPYAPAQRPDPPAGAVTRRTAFRSFPDGEGVPGR
jgi:DNA-binding transcriptional ArsR family regulator